MRNSINPEEIKTEIEKLGHREDDEENKTGKETFSTT
jgi:hypothetical protein